MKKSFFVAGCLLLVTGSWAQTVNQKLQNAFQQFERDAQLKHAISSLFVIDAKTGKVVFDKNSQIGLAPASTLKVITSVTAFELLGKGFRYETEFSISDSLLYITGSGDPTFGSSRFDNTREDYVVKKATDELKAKGIKSLDRMVVIYEGKFSSNSIPNGWIWEDIGNYYGAGTKGFNWRENQFDITLKSGDKIGDTVEIIKTNPEVHGFAYYSELKSAEKNSGDNAYIYYSMNGNSGIVRGTIPVGEKSFTISGSLPTPGRTFLDYFINYLEKQKMVKEYMKYRVGVYRVGNPYHDSLIKKSKKIYTHYSPALDSVIYWFNKKSINLYGEALIKTFAYEKNGFGSTDSGVAIVKDFWKKKGLDEDELNISDGSGLSPQNRVTTHAQVEILKYAKNRSWFAYFYKSLPEYNGMIMKSGTIKDVKGFCGYHKAKDGKEYIFSFLVNNYNGSSAGLVNKMYRVLDVLK